MEGENCMPQTGSETSFASAFMCGQVAEQEALAALQVFPEVLDAHDLLAHVWPVVIAAAWTASE